ncbi:hypothetical protein AB0L59_30070 [Streptomyces sp. NPDC052109]|uniref:hypothetical protein n=1 Tax=Streptomyces sp. NPDC052109 TaxID=3155527 RepID=UPI0034345F0D
MSDSGSGESRRHLQRMDRAVQVFSTNRHSGGTTVNIRKAVFKRNHLHGEDCPAVYDLGASSPPSG